MEAPDIKGLIPFLPSSPEKETQGNGRLKDTKDSWCHLRFLVKATASGILVFAAGRTEMLKALQYDTSSSPRQQHVPGKKTVSKRRNVTEGTGN